MSNLESRLDVAFSKLGMREPFIAAVMSRVEREVRDDVKDGVRTAATNGKWVRFNRGFCDPLTDEQLYGLVLHESCHIILMHSWRRGDRQPGLWNIANDGIINHYILSRKEQLPAGGVNIRWITESMSSEDVYERLKQEQQKNGGKGDPAHGEAGGFDGTGDLHDAPDEATAVDIEATIATAAEMARACGQGSSLIDRVLGARKPSQVRWQDVVRSMLTSAAAADFTYRRFSRRHIASGLYLPSLYSEALGGLAIGFDTSGSMSKDDCDQIASEVQSIADDLNPEFLEVVYCDSSITRVEFFDRDDRLELSPKGGGGTRFQPVFQHFAESERRYCGMIFFTDMEGDLEECVQPEFPVVWANIGRRQYEPPFGVAVPVPI
jgi:predicted metal-dependent peptidase